MTKRSSAIESRSKYDSFVSRYYDFPLEPLDVFLDSLLIGVRLTLGIAVVVVASALVMSMTCMVLACKVM